MRLFPPGDPASPPGLLAFDLQFKSFRYGLCANDRQARTTLRNIRDRAHDGWLAGTRKNKRGLVIARPADMFSTFYQGPVSLIRAGRCSRLRLRYTSDQEQAAVAQNF